MLELRVLLLKYYSTLSMPRIRALLITVIIKRLVNRNRALFLRSFVLLTKLFLHLMLYILLLLELQFNLLINHCILLNTHCSGGKEQSWVCLFVMNQTWTDTSAYCSFTVATKTLTQKSCQFGVSKWNMRSSYACLWLRMSQLFRNLSQTSYAITKSCYRFVNIFCFLKPHWFWSSLVEALRTGEIHDGQ